MSDNRRIYVASLADYNSGVLHGAWIDCDDKSADELQDEVNAILRTSKYPNVTVDCPDCDGTGIVKFGSDQCPACHGLGTVPSAEEWAIHDHEGFYGLVSESTSFETVAQACELIAEHGEAYARYAENLGGNDLPDAEDFQDHYQGTFDTVEAYAENFAEDTGMLDSIPENLRNYFDMERFARDMELGGDIYALDTAEGKAIFSN